VSFYIFLACVFVLFLIMAIGLYYLLNEPEYEQPESPRISAPKIVDYLVAPESRLSCIFVTPDAVTDFVIGKMPFTEEAQGGSNIKLIRSGTGFRVYDHPTVKWGQWLPCR